MHTHTHAQHDTDTDESVMMKRRSSECKIAPQKYATRVAATAARRATDADELHERRCRGQRDVAHARSCARRPSRDPARHNRQGRASRHTPRRQITANGAKGGESESNKDASASA